MSLARLFGVWCGAALAGFVLALLGLLIGGCVAPVPATPTLRTLLGVAADEPACVVLGIGTCQVHGAGAVTGRPQ